MFEILKKKNFNSTLEQEFFLEIADSVVESIKPEIARTAHELLKQLTVVDTNDESIVGKALEELSLGVPISSVRGAADIIEAGWKFWNSDYPSWDTRYPEVYSSKMKCAEMLNE